MNNRSQLPVIIGAIIVAVLILCILMIPTGEPDQSTRFRTIYADDVYIIIVDQRTGVEYIRDVRGGICPLIDSYGSPVLYPGFDAREDRPV